MTESQADRRGFQVDSRLLVGGMVLMGVGSALGLAGLALASSAVFAASRRWVREMDVPPSELARQKWAQARAATSAGIGAWRDGQPAGQALPS
jgi:hypothetical protein